MKATIVSQVVYESVEDYVHGGKGKEVRSLWILEIDLMIIVDGNEVYAFHGFGSESAPYKTLGVVDIPDELVTKALELILVQTELNEMGGLINGLTYL